MKTQKFNQTIERIYRRTVITQFNSDNEIVISESSKCERNEQLHQ